MDIPIVVSDDAGSSRTLRFGLDPIATDSMDTILGEAEYPPAPPAGIFDARFIGQDIQIPLGEGTIRDYRKGDGQTVGSMIHELKYQVSSGSTIIISWNLPAGVTGRLQDLVLGTLVDVPMRAAGQYVVTNPSGFPKLRLTFSYGVTGVQEDATLPGEFRLEQNYPNPFNPTTMIKFALPEAGEVSLELYNMLGQKVAALAEGYRKAGYHQIDLNASDFASGVYFYRLQAGALSAVKRLVVLN